jgi:hypothetical protein
LKTVFSLRGSYRRNEKTYNKQLYIGCFS